MRLIVREAAPSLKRVASVFATEHNKNAKSEKDVHSVFDEKVLEEYESMEVTKVNFQNQEDLPSCLKVNLSVFS